MKSYSFKAKYVLSHAMSNLLAQELLVRIPLHALCCDGFVVVQQLACGMVKGSIMTPLTIKCVFPALCSCGNTDKKLHAKSVRRIKYGQKYEQKWKRGEKIIKNRWKERTKKMAIIGIIQRQPIKALYK